ncbi:helix-turn-helix transcriptional regulator [Erythrobacter rubeus]|uniref:Autoinducer binding domain-containing protein n=1 Tax=Erythrobacter rubeus TaxID=2760803 RepID=A0ABR8KLV7_9SPHN|nr:LuxR family transcriptional regulator [Erythrobacter rubeus]MBD2841405.1 autoinducer binding domain-containing protein [Erythrobacter rubeus]
MQNFLIDFVSRFEAADGFDDKWACLVQTYAALGFNVVNYTVFPDAETHQDPVFIENFRNNWKEHYAARDYGSVDAMIPHVLGTNIPAIMYSVDERQPLDWPERARQLIAEAKEAGMERAVGFSHRNADGVVDGGVALGTDLLSETEFSKIVKDKLPLLYMIYSIAYHELHPERRQLAALETLKISPRQQDLLMALWDGLSNKQISERLGVSEVTVSFHLKQLRGKLGCHLNREIIPKAYHRGLLGNSARRALRAAD